MCFPSSEKRVEWIREKQKEEVQFLAHHCTREELIEEYGLILEKI
jgi:hypothetical protein